MEKFLHRFNAFTVKSNVISMTVGAITGEEIQRT